MNRDEVVIRAIIFFFTSMFLSIVWMGFHMHNSFDVAAPPVGSSGAAIGVADVGSGGGEHAGYQPASSLITTGPKDDHHYHDESCVLDPIPLRLDQLGLRAGSFPPSQVQLPEPSLFQAGPAQPWALLPDPAAKYIWIEFSQDQPVQVAEYRIRTSAPLHAPKSWTLSAYAQEGEPVVLDTRAWVTWEGARKRFVLPNSRRGAYSRFRLTFEDLSDTQLELSGLELWGCEGGAGAPLPASASSASVVATVATVATALEEDDERPSRSEFHTPPLVLSKVLQVPLSDEERAVAAKMKYWRPVQEPLLFPNTWLRGDQVKYCVFNADVGAFNNKRVFLETAVLFAMTTGRTLVMPFDLEYGFGDYFALEDIARVVHTIPAREFITRFYEKVFGSGELDDVKSIFDAGSDLDRTQYNKCLRKLNPFVHSWKPALGTDMLVLPENAHSAQHCDATCAAAAKRHRPPSGGALVEYTQEMQAEPIWWFPEDKPRLLVTFNAFINFQDPNDERRAYLLMRNHVHLNGFLYDMAAQIVAKLGINSYCALHIRRGDLQYKQAKLDARGIFENTKALFKDKGCTDLYIASDEHAPAYFQPLADHYTLHFFDDFPEVKEMSLNLPSREGRQQGDKYYEMFWSPDYSGMVEAIVCSMANRFVGTLLSTFSELIFILRGYQEHIEDRSVYLHTNKYSGDQEIDAHKDTAGNGGTGFHWQFNDNLRWKYNDWHYRD